MLSSLFKKKFTDDQLATIFVNGILEVIDKGFEDVKMMMKEDPAFIREPQLQDAKDGHFTLIVFVGNIRSLGDSFTPSQQKTLEPLIFQKLAKNFEMGEKEFKNLYSDYSSFMKRVNHPSKVVLYSMSKAMFHKYELNEYQDKYFKSLSTPNPLFLKRMDEVMKNFLWNWDAFFKRYKVQS